MSGHFPGSVVLAQNSTGVSSFVFPDTKIAYYQSICSIVRFPRLLRVLRGLLGNISGKGRFQVRERSVRKTSLCSLMILWTFRLSLSRRGRLGKWLDSSRIRMRFRGLGCSNRKMLKELKNTR